jgi:imidazole glycerol phosphate synthase, glutamine amidotransferase subunit
VGEASSAMTHLRHHRLDEVIRNLSQPLLGICIGQQLLCAHSEEGDTDCIGIFDVPVKRFQPSADGLKIPHMGWNRVKLTTENPLLTEALDNNFVYYVHSFYVPLNCWTIAKTKYIGEFSAAMRKDNFFATQFHPEKSGDVGERILKNFIEL